MSKKGGYKIIDLANLPLSDVATSLPGIHNAIEGNRGKVILLSGINFEGVEKADVYVQFNVDSGSFVADIYDKVITITADDEITIEDKSGGNYTSEEWTFTLEDDTEITKNVVIEEV